MTIWEDSFLTRQGSSKFCSYLDACLITKLGGLRHDFERKEKLLELGLDDVVEEVL